MYNNHLFLHCKDQSHSFYPPNLKANSMHVDEMQFKPLQHKRRSDVSKKGYTSTIEY